MAGATGWSGECGFVMGGMICAHAIVVNAIIYTANVFSAATAWVYPVRCNTSSSTNLLPKNASTSSAIAVRVQRTALAPRQP
jgi:hypothetical protein